MSGRKKKSGSSSSRNSSAWGWLIPAAGLLLIGSTLLGDSSILAGNAWEYVARIPPIRIQVDGRNRKKVLINAGPKREISLEEFTEVANDSKLKLYSTLKVNGENRYRMVGRTRSGRFITIIILILHDSLFRYITCYESSPSQIKAYEQFSK